MTRKRTHLTAIRIRDGFIVTLGRPREGQGAASGAHRGGTGGERGSRGAGWSRHIVQLNLVNKNRVIERRKENNGLC